MMDGNPGCRTHGSGVNPDQKKSVFDILLPMSRLRTARLMDFRKV